MENLTKSLALTLTVADWQRLHAAAAEHENFWHPERQSAIAALADAIEAAPWGRQEGTHGRVFIRRGTSHLDHAPWSSLCIDGVVLAGVCRSLRGERRVEVTRDIPDAQAQRRHDRQVRAAEHRQYLADLAAVAGWLRAGRWPEGWMVRPGQEGGVALLPSGRKVSFAGAMRRAFGPTHVVMGIEDERVLVGLGDSTEVTDWHDWPTRDRLRTGIPLEEEEHEPTLAS